MFCPTCGIETIEPLKYCRNCGASQNFPADPAPPTPIPFRLIFLFLLIAVVGVSGMGGVMTMGFDLARSHVPLDHMMAVLLLGTFITMGTIGALSWLLVRLSKHSRPALAERPAPGKRVSAERPPVGPSGGVLDPVPSIVEHTTRSFEPTRSKRPAASPTN